MTDTVKVRIEATQKVRYSQIRDIPVDLFDKYEKMCEADRIRDEDFNNAFGHLINDSDISEADDLSDLTITKTKPI